MSWPPKHLQTLQTQIPDLGDPGNGLDEAWMRSGVGLDEAWTPVAALDASCTGWSWSGSGYLKLGVVETAQTDLGTVVVTVAIPEQECEVDPASSMIQNVQKCIQKFLSSRVLTPCYATGDINKRV